MPLISVIVPVYKVEPYINRCVDSILAQTCSDFEVILVDDGSPDNCGKICDEYAERDARVHVIHQENGGLSAARNAGIDWSFANSDSQWLTFVDSDDWVHSRFLEIMMDAAAQTGEKVVIADYIVTGEHHSDDSVEVTSVNAFNSRKFFCEQNMLSTMAWGKLYKKECFSSVRYPVGKIHEDEFTTYRILFAIDNIAYVPVPLYYYFYNETGISKLPYSLKKLDAVDALRERFLYVRKLGDIPLTNFCLTAYITLSEENIRRINDSSSIPEKQRKKTVRRLMRDMRSILVKYGFQNRFWRDNIGMFLRLFPILKVPFKICRFY